MPDQLDPEYVAARMLVGRHVMGAMAGYAVGAAAELGLADALADNEKTTAELAEAVHIPAQNLLRLLRAVTALGLLTEKQPGTFELTPAGALLRTDQPGNLNAFARIFVDPVMLAGWQHLTDSLRTSERGFDQEFGTDFFAHLETDPPRSRLFDAAMHAGTRGIGTRLAEILADRDYGGATEHPADVVADIGGGDGTLLAEVLAAWPNTTGILFDTERGLVDAPAGLEAAGVADRCRLESGDFFTAVPAGAQLYLLKSIVHDWSDEQSALILRHCRDQLDAKGAVVFLEPLLPDVVDPAGGAGAYLSDLNMLVNVGGRERTRADFEQLCAAAGLMVRSMTPLFEGHAFVVIEAVRDDAT